MYSECSVVVNLVTTLFRLHVHVRDILFVTQWDERGGADRNSGVRR